MSRSSVSSETETMLNPVIRISAARSALISHVTAAGRAAHLETIPLTLFKSIFC